MAARSISPVSVARFRYSRWDGTQHVDLPDPDDILSALSDELMASGDLNAALQRLYRWGSEDIPGLEQMLRQLRDLREQQLARHDLDSVVADLKQQVQDVVDTERAGIEKRLAESEPGSPRQVLEKVARRRRDQLDRLPEDLGGRIKSLRDYEFMDGEAETKFRELLQRLQQQMLDQTFRGMKDALRATSSADLDRMRDMVRELNRMLERRMQGQPADFASFKERFGDMFPSDVESLDQLLEHLQRQMGQMESLLRSLSPQARRELQDLIENLLEDDGLRLELARLGGFMQAMMPPSEMADRHPFFGDEPLGLQQAMQLMDRLQAMDRLEAQLERGSFRLDDVDRSAVDRILGPEARAQLDRLRQVREVLEREGLVERKGRRVELTPKGLRRIGQSALRDIFDQLKRTRFGQHQLRAAGSGIDQDDEVKPYEYGDPFIIDLNATLFSSLERQGPGLPIQLNPADFMVRRTEQMSQASTVLMIDMSRSMFLRGCFLAAKKVAMALDALIRSQFPRDTLYLIGFSSYAVELKPESLPQISLSDYVSGTNMQHGFQMARSLLSRHRGNRQIIMVTDGEPTAHIEHGEAEFHYPPTPRTISETLREVRACTRERIRINTFMLERGPYLVEFVQQMTRINRGRAFFVLPDRLGEHLLVDYITGRRRTSRS